MMSINFADVYISPRKSYFDYSVTTYVEKHNECQRSLAWWTHHEDGDEFMFVDLLFCDSIQTILMTDYYGFNFHSWEEYVEYSPELYDTQPQVAIFLDEIKEILNKMYPTYKVYRYNKGFYKNLQEKAIQETWDRVNAVSDNMISDIEVILFHKVLPMWCRFYKKYHKNRWDTHKLYRNNYEDAKNLFYYQWDNLKELDDQCITDRCDYNGVLSHVVHRP